LELDLKNQGQGSKGDSCAEDQEERLRFASLNEPSEHDSFSSFDDFIVVGFHIYSYRCEKCQREAIKSTIEESSILTCHDFSSLLAKTFSSFSILPLTESTEEIQKDKTMRYAQYNVEQIK
jgi:hypothetical protein